MDSKVKRQELEDEVATECERETTGFGSQEAQRE